MADGMDGPPQSQGGGLDARAVAQQFDEELRDAQDLELLSRVASVGDVRCVPEVMGAYRIHGNSMSARDLGLQRANTRFIRARLEKRERGGDLSWEEFARGYRRSWRQSYGDRLSCNKLVCSLSLRK